MSKDLTMINNYEEWLVNGDTDVIAQAYIEESRNTETVHITGSLFNLDGSMNFNNLQL